MPAARRRLGFASFMFSSKLLWLAFALAFVAAAAWGLRLAAQPVSLRVAVGPADGADAKFIAAIAKQLGRAKLRINFTIVPTSGPAESAAALDNGKADLAVVRTDIGMPAKGGTMLIVHKDAAIIVAPRGSGVKKIADLAKKKFAVVPGIPANVLLLDAILSHYGVNTGSVQHVPMSAGDVAAAIQNKSIDAAMVVAIANSHTAEEVVSAVGPPNRPSPVFIDVADAEGIAQSQPAFEKAEIPSGLYKGSPPRPAESVTTISVAYHLVASQDVRETLVTRLTKRILAWRRALAAETPLAVTMEAPETDKGSQFPLHPGAEAYFDDNEKSFLDRYGDWIYLGAMFLSAIGSAFAALFGARASKERHETMKLIDRLIAVKQEAHQAPDLNAAAALENKIEALSTQGLLRARDDHFDEAGLEAFRLAIEEARRALAARRHELRSQALGGGAATRLVQPADAVEAVG